MQNSNTITIVCICDNHYAILLSALIKSIEMNHKTGELLEFMIVEDDISPSSRDKIDKSIHKDSSIIWMAMSQCLPAGYKLPVDKSTLPLNIYVRLFIPYFLPEDTQKVIFLDVDMIVLSDISILWNLDLESNIIAAVQDQFIQVVSRWGGLSNFEQLGLTSETKYFNAGLMVIDLVRWRRNDVTNKVLEMISKYKEFAQFQDQYGLNATLANQWLELDPLWNRFAYSIDDKPHLIHFTGRKPIYKSYNYSQNYKNLFYFYLHETEWRNFKPISESSRYLKKASNILAKLKNILK